MKTRIFLLLMFVVTACGRQQTRDRANIQSGAEVQSASLLETVAALNNGLQRPDGAYHALACGGRVEVGWAYPTDPQGFRVSACYEKSGVPCVAGQYQPVGHVKGSERTFSFPIEASQFSMIRVSVETIENGQLSPPAESAAAIIDSLNCAGSGSGQPTPPTEPTPTPPAPVSCNVRAPEFLPGNPRVQGRQFVVSATNFTAADKIEMELSLDGVQWTIAARYNKPAAGLVSLITSPQSNPASIVRVRLRWYGGNCNVATPAYRFP